MSTIASPRPSISTSSRRTSTSTDTTTTTTTTPTQAAERGSLRRNRTALRDYYNLQPSHPDTLPPPQPLSPDRDSEIDAPGFNPQTYITALLATSDLEPLLRVEAGLVSEIRSLDGEKKALVYDNYSKLIAATETIKQMRERMDPLTPTTSTLTPAVGHIAETAEALAEGLRGGEKGVERKREGQRESVKWVLGAPGRLRRLVEEGRGDEAEREWVEVEGLLGKWVGVRGVEDVRKGCLEALGREDG